MCFMREARRDDNLAVIEMQKLYGSPFGCAVKTMKVCEEFRSNISINSIRDLMMT